MPPLLLVMIGGAIGTAGRYLVGMAALRRFGPGFPAGTLTVNLIGGMLMGLLAGILARIGGAEDVRLFVGVGVLGGFTTFSAFSLETYGMIERGQLPLAAFYAGLSVCGAVASLGLGLRISRIFA